MNAGQYDHLLKGSAETGPFVFLRRGGPRRGELANVIFETFGVKLLTWGGKGPMGRIERLLPEGQVRICNQSDKRYSRWIMCRECAW
jgi:hypothetical protein